MTTYTPPPELRRTPSRRNRPFPLVIGILLALVGFPLLLGGLGLGWAMATQRDDDGFFSTLTEQTTRLSTSPAGMKRDAEGEWKPWMSPANPDTPEAPAFDMPLTVGENTAREMGLTRLDVDEWAVYSHANAIASIDSGAFVNEIVPMTVTRPDGEKVEFAIDEFPRRGVTVESLSQLPVLRPDVLNPTVTAGNSAGINDAAAAVMPASDDYAHAHALAPLARILSWAAVGIEPKLTSMAPTLPIPKALERASLTLGDIDLFEINEAFCSVPVAAVRQLGIPQEIVNLNGSGASLGHPIAATGARMIVTMIHERGVAEQPLAAPGEGQGHEAHDRNGARPLLGRTVNPRFTHPATQGGWSTSGTEFPSDVMIAIPAVPNGASCPAKDR